MVALFWLVGIALSIALGLASGLGWFYFIAAVVSGGWLLGQNQDFVRHPTAKRGEQFFYQSANYRAWLFAALIIDVLLRAILLQALPQLGWL
jgi:4-hydroxybenzoate polyprenyltransferase